VCYVIGSFPSADRCQIDLHRGFLDIGKACRTTPRCFLLFSSDLILRSIATLHAAGGVDSCAMMYVMASVIGTVGLLAIAAESWG
jgi:hypothetical protein